jgi:hypothetical protein
VRQGFWQLAQPFRQLANSLVYIAQREGGWHRETEQKSRHCIFAQSDKHSLLEQLEGVFSGGGTFGCPARLQALRQASMDSSRCLEHLGVQLLQKGKS